MSEAVSEILRHKNYIVDAVYDGQEALDYINGQEAPSVDAVSGDIEIGSDPLGGPVAGFGPALTGASCYNLLRMPQEARTALLKECFDPAEGLGWSLVRCSIGASDFSVDEDLTWCDTPGLEHFAVHREDSD